MAAEKPIGSPDDFKHLTPFEREKQEALRRASAQERENVDPEAAFRAEMARVDETKKKAEAARRQFEESKGQPQVVDTQPTRLYHLLCAKKGEKISVIGMYSTREELVNAILHATPLYAGACQKLGTVDFNINLKVDQLPVDPIP